ncbi:protein kinase, ATP binding site-containing protein [Tanacetum coccineum]
MLSERLKTLGARNMEKRHIRSNGEAKNHEAASTITIRRHQCQNLDNYLIPLEEIKLATRNFSKESQFAYSRSGYFFRGQLSKCWKKRTAAFKRYTKGKRFEEWFRNEIQMISSFNHENIIGFLGYCDEGDEKVIVYDYASKGSLIRLLENNKKRKYIKWVERLKICIGSVRGLMYLQSGRGEDKILIHNNFKSTNIWLNDKLEPLIGGLYMSIVVDKNQGDVFVDDVAGIESYMDPNYLESGIIKAEADVYAMGVVMFEMLSGMAITQSRSIGDSEPQALINLVRRYYVKGLDILIDPFIKDQIDIQSLHIFKEIAYKCISLNLKDRPSLNRILKRLEEALHIQNSTDASTICLQSQSSSLHQKLEDFRVPLKEINAATGNFSKDTWIGEGGFGDVYRGQLSKSWQNCTAAIKRLNRNGGQGKEEFRNELELIFKFRHENIINFLGYCDEDNEMIIVNEYASNGSLDGYLEDTDKRRNLTWIQRLRICLGTARGLDYLHWGLGENNRVIHRDVKSGNILLDQNLEAKICDFGLSKSGPPNQPHSKLYTKAAGTRFYMDPVYHESGMLQKESDVYSLGVVMLELLTGMLAYYEKAIEKDDEPQFLINLVRRYFDDGLDMLIDPFIKDQIDRRSLHTFKYIAYECISLNSKDRPTIDTIIDRLEEALDFQVSLCI